jgi:hypothetical protein
LGAGRVRFAINPALTSHDDEATTVAIDGTGKLVGGGFTQLSGMNYDFAVARLSYAGTLDPTFAVNGKQVLGFSPAVAPAAALAIQQGLIPKIVAAGSAQLASAGPVAAVARLDGGRLRPVHRHLVPAQGQQRRGAAADAVPVRRRRLEAGPGQLNVLQSYA